MCARQASTGSGSSSRVAAATASQSRSTSGSPKTDFAALVRVGEDRPVDQALVRRLDVALGELASSASCRRGRRRGRRAAPARDRRRAGSAHRAAPRVVDLGERPRRRPAERVLVAHAGSARGGRAGRSSRRRRSGRRSRRRTARPRARAAHARAERTPTRPGPRRRWSRPRPQGGRSARAVLRASSAEKPSARVGTFPRR